MGNALNLMDHVCVAMIIALLIMVCICLVRAIIGPRVADRIVAVNMIGTMTIMILSIYSVFLRESYLLDISIVYAMMSFLAVVILCKIYLGVYKEQKQKKENQDKGGQE